MNCLQFAVRATVLGIAMMSSAVLAAPAGANEPLVGVWQTVVNSQITIRTCDDGYCGYVSKVVIPADKVSANDLAAHPAKGGISDFHNKDPDLRDRPILGLQILALRESDKPGIYDGEVYNPEDGNTYSGYMEVLGPDSIRLKGCVLFNIVCKGEEWVRVDH